MFDARLADELRGAEMENPPHPPVQLGRGEPGDARKLGGSHGLIQMFADVVRHFGDTGEFRIPFAWCPEVAGNRGDANDGTGGIMQGDLGREVPAERTVAIGHQFQVIGDFAALKHLFILLTVGFRERGRKKVLGEFADQASGIL